MSTGSGLSTHLAQIAFWRTLKMKIRTLALVFLMLSCAVVFAGTRRPRRTDPWVGDWKMDVSKSNFPTPGPKEETLTIAAADATAVKYSTKGTGPDGVPYTESYDGKPDGKAYPLTKNEKKRPRSATIASRS